jgi:hypothetical protein
MVFRSYDFRLWNDPFGTLRCNLDDPVPLLCPRGGVLCVGFREWALIGYKASLRVVPSRRKFNSSSSVDWLNFGTLHFVTRSKRKCRKRDLDFNAGEENCRVAFVREK